jgi:hypothetical protein
MQNLEVRKWNIVVLREIDHIEPRRNALQVLHNFEWCKTKNAL